MNEKSETNSAQIDKLYIKLKNEAESGGYHLNPDEEFTKELAGGLLVNEGRYGYQACPCRLASGVKQNDLDIICPCDYRDADLDAHDACYCGLYVSDKILSGEKKLTSIPERRRRPLSNLPMPVWRCKVCGYLCAREHPPEICPICKVKKERFEKFI